MSYKTETQRRLGEVLDALDVGARYFEKDGIFTIEREHLLIYEHKTFPDRVISESGKLYTLAQIQANGLLTYSDGSEVRIKYCTACKKFYFSKHIPKAQDACPMCASQAIKYLNNNGRIPQWFGKETDSLVDEAEIEKRLDVLATIDEDDSASVKAIINKLRGAPSYLKITDEKCERVSALGEKYPNMREVIDYLTTSFKTASLKNNEAISFKPMVLVGGPGCGKTSFTTELCAILMGRNALKIDLGNKIASFTLTGSDLSYSRAKHGLIIESMFSGKDGHPLKNPIIHFDELDKIHTDDAHNVETVFYAILEKNTAKRFYDNYISVNVDASGINYIFTANSLESVPKPIINRLKVFVIEDYSREQLKSVLNNFYAKWIKNNDMQPEFLPAVLSGEIKERILDESNNDTRCIDDAINKIFSETRTQDSETGHTIALFSPTELYLGWKKFRGSRMISKTAWKLPQGFLKTKTEGENAERERYEVF